MKLRYIKAERFKSLREFEVEIGDFTVFIGENNAGKSNLFYALDLFFSSSARDFNEKCCFGYKTSEPAIITCRFDTLTLEENKPDMLGPWVVDGELTVTKEYRLGPDKKANTSYYALDKVPAESWLRDDFPDYNKRDALSALPIYSYLPGTGRINKENYSNAIKEFIKENAASIEWRIEKRENPRGYKQVLDGYLPEFHLVPAIRDVTEETKTSQTAYLGRILNVIIQRLAADSPAFQKLAEIIAQVKKEIEGETPEQKLPEILDLEQRLRRALSTWDIGVNIEVDPPGVDKVFQLGTKLILDDGLPEDAESKGHGLQRSLIFALMRVWSEFQRLPTGEGPTGIRERFNIFAFEEPELFLHPQMCRATYESLKNLSSSVQILLSTHSSHFVNMDDYKDLVIIRKPTRDEGTTNHRVATDLYEGDREKKKRFNMVRYFNPDRGEIFFARKVILVEGATEKSLFPLLGQRLGVFDHSVSIVDCAGKFNLSLFVAVLNAFEIPYLTIYDEDPIPEEIKPGGKDYERSKYQEAKNTYDENARIESGVGAGIGRTFMVPGKIEKILGIPASRCDKLGKPCAAVEYFENEDNVVPELVERIVREVYS